MMTDFQKKEVEDLVSKQGGPISTIQLLISELSDGNKESTTEMIKHILSIRYVSKKTFIGDQSFDEYLVSNGIIIN